MNRTHPLPLLLALLTLVACSEDRPRTSPTAPLAPPPPQPLEPAPAPSSFDGSWMGTVQLDVIGDVRGQTKTDCVAAALQQRFARREPVAFDIAKGSITFRETPKRFGKCVGGYAPYYGTEWDIFCSFQIPFDVTCDDGSTVRLYFPNWEDDLGFEIETDGENRIAFDFVEAFATAPGNATFAQGYWVSFRFELERSSSQ